MQGDKIPDEIMQIALGCCTEHDVAYAIMARDKRAAEIARAFADSEEINALSGTSATNEVGDPGWIKDALHSNGVDVSNSIAAAILSYNGGSDEQR